MINTESTPSSMSSQIWRWSVPGLGERESQGQYGSSMESVHGKFYKDMLRSETSVSSHPRSLNLRYLTLIFLYPLLNLWIVRVCVFVHVVCVCVSVCVCVCLCVLVSVLCVCLCCVPARDRTGTNPTFSVFVRARDRAGTKTEKESSNLIEFLINYHWDMSKFRK